MWDNNKNLRKEGSPGQNNYQDNYLGDGDFISLSSGAASLSGPQFFQQSNQMPEGYMPNQLLQTPFQHMPGFSDMNGLEQNVHLNPTTVVSAIKGSDLPRG